MAVIFAVGLNLIQLSAIGLLYLELSDSNSAPGANDPKLTGNSSETGHNKTDDALARYFPVSNVEMHLQLYWS